MKKYPQVAVLYGAKTDEVFTVLEEDLVPQEEYNKLVEKRENGELTNLGMYLPDIFDWNVVRDSDKQLVLIATRKATKLSTVNYPPEDRSGF